MFLSCRHLEQLLELGCILFHIFIYFIISHAHQNQTTLVAQWARIINATSVSASKELCSIWIKGGVSHLPLLCSNLHFTILLGHTG